jgi:hypothetical protein
MPATNKNLLIVEGKGEQYAIPELMDFHTVWGDKPKDWVVEIKEMNGVKSILKRGTISAASKTPGLRALGVIVDADDEFPARWERLKQLCGEFAGEVPNDLPANGLIHVSPTGLRVGVWIMPDNSSRGMMETFLARLLSPDCWSIWGEGPGIVRGSGQSPKLAPPFAPGQGKDPHVPCLDRTATPNVAGGDHRRRDRREITSRGSIRLVGHELVPINSAR